MKDKPKVYLAGPEVFLPNADQIGHQKKALCHQYGFEGLFPLDSELSAQALQGPAQDLGFAISAANEQLIESCDLLIANLTPFRSPSADVGTVYELGLARGLGKPIYGYSNCLTPYHERIWQQFGILNAQHHPLKPIASVDDLRDRDGLKIEQFDLNDNLMIEGGIRLSGGGFWCPHHGLSPKRQAMQASDLELDEDPMSKESTVKILADLTGFKTLLIEISTLDALSGYKIDPH